MMAGCGGGTPNSNVSNSNNVANNSNNPLETKKTTPEPETNNAPTLTPVFKAYCEAKIKNDEAGLRKAYSADTIKYFESQMKADKIKTLVEYLKLDRVSADLCEISNEKITGNKAVARIRTVGYPNGLDVIFVNENGEWKMTSDSPTYKSVPPGNANSTAK
jgi:hypothetical protein